MRYAALLLVARAFAQTPCEPTPLYTPCDIVFEVQPGEADKPDIRAEMRSPKFKTAMIRAFEHSPGQWVIRVAPVDAGEYTYRITSNIARLHGKTGSVTAVAGERRSFIQVANVFHFWHPETLTPHLWTGAACLDCFTIPRADFDARAAQFATAKVNHVRVRLAMEEMGPNERNRDIEARLKALNERGIIADLILSDSPREMAAKYPGWRERSEFAEYVANRFSAFDVTWLIFRDWEDGKDGRAMAKEIGAILKKSDPNNHPRSTGARMTSASLAGDDWMDYINLGTAEESLARVEREFYGKPFVVSAEVRGSSEEVRKKFWRSTMTNAYPSMDGVPLELVKQWNEVFSRTRYWDLGPWYDVDGGRSTALPAVEYLVYIEKPSGPVEVGLEKHTYQVYWIDPATGQVTKAKDFRGEKFVGEPPDKAHDWLLHLSRDGRKEGMAKSYRFEARPQLAQEIEFDPAKVPFEIAEPSAEQLSLGGTVKYEAVIKRQTRATREMFWVWSADVVADGQGYRVFGLERSGTVKLPPDLAVKFPGVVNVRLAAVNANGKAYALDRVYRLVP
jgi:hypothetical protein